MLDGTRQKLLLHRRSTHMCWRGMMSTKRTHTKLLSCAISVCSGEGKTSSPDHTSLIFLSIHTCSFTHLPQHIYRQEKTNMCENLNFVHQELSNEKAACLLLMQERKMAYEKLNFVQKELLKEKVAKQAACVQLALAQKNFLKRGKEMIANQATCSKTQWIWYRKSSIWRRRRVCCWCRNGR